MTKPSPVITQLVSVFEQVAQALPSADTDAAWHVVGDDGIWTCDGGAVFLAYLADAMGLLRELHVGLYWHHDPALLASLRGDDLEDVIGEPLDEHHHWVEVYDPQKRVWWLVDPNGEIRREPRLQLSTDALASIYGADDRQSVWSGIDSHTDVSEYVRDDPSLTVAARLAEPLLVSLGFPAPTPSPAL